MALLSDLTREQHRTKAMAMIGMSIGVSFAVAMVLGPVLTHLFGLHGLFWFTAGMALVGLLLILFFVPQPDHMTQHRESSVARQALLPTLKHGDLLRLDAGILILHAILMASFVALPLALVHEGPAQGAALVGLPDRAAGRFLRHGAVHHLRREEASHEARADRRGGDPAGLRTVLPGLRSQPGHAGGRHGGVLHCFQPARSLAAVAGQQGLAGRRQGHGDGVYSTSQFLGAALGGILGGWMFQHGGLSMVFIGCAVLAALWLAIAVTMREPPYVTSIRLPLAPAALQDAVLVQRFRALPGVANAVVVAEEAAAYVKVDTQQVDRTALERLAQAAPGGC